MAEKKNDAYYSSLPAAEKKRYKEKVEGFTKTKFVDPYEIVDGWKDDISLWPPTDFPTLHSYLIDTSGQYTLEKLKAFKSLEAYNYYIW